MGNLFKIRNIFIVVSFFFSFEALAQSKCAKPIFRITSTNSATINSIKITRPNSNFNKDLYFKSNTINSVDINTGVTLNYNTANNISYRAEVEIYKFAGSVGLFFDYNLDNIPDAFTPLSSTNNQNFFANFTLLMPIGVNPSQIRVFVLSIDLATMNGSSFCSKSYSEGELETYLFNTFSCDTYPKELSAGVNDTICAGNTVELIGSIPVMKGNVGYWKPSSFKLKDSTALIQKLTLKQSEIFTLNFKDGYTGCEFITTKRALVDLVPEDIGLTLIQTNSPILDSICPGESIAMSLTNTTRLGTLSVAWKNKSDLKPILVGNSQTFTAKDANIYFAEVSYAKIAACGGGFLKTKEVEVRAKRLPNIFLDFNSTCLGSANFVAKSTDKIRSYTWNYYYGANYDNAPNATNSTNYTPSKAGTYFVTVESGINTCKTNSKEITVFAPPATPIINKIAPICPNANASLTLASNPEPNVTYEWYNDPKQQAVFKGVSYTTNKPANYWVKGVSAQLCSSSFSEPATLSIAAVESMRLSPSGSIPHCESKQETIAITSTSVNLKTVNWYLNSLKSNPVSTATSTYISAANFSGKIYVTAQNFNGCNMIDSVSILLVDQSKLATILSKGELCTGQSVTLFSDVTSGSRYVWKRNSVVVPSDIGNNPNQLTINSSGDYTVDIDISGGNQLTCPLKSTVFKANFVQTPIPSNDYTIKGNLILCNSSSQTTLSVTPSTAPNVSYQWYKNNLEIVNNLPTLATKDTGNYQLAFYNGKCFAPKTPSVKVSIINLPNPLIVAKNNVLCVSENTGFSMSSPIFRITPPVIWYKDNIAVPANDGGLDINFIPKQSGFYTMSYISQACTSSTSNGVNISPKLTVNAGPNLITCENAKPFNIKAISSNPKVTYNWLGQNNTNADQSVLTISPSNARLASYLVIVNDNTNNCSAIDTVFVDIKQNTMQITNQQKDIICDGGMGSSTINVVGGNQPYTYYWISYNAATDKVDTIVSKTNTTNLKSGWYDVKVEDALGCNSFIYERFIQSPKPSKLKISTKVIQPLCIGNTNGSIEVSLSNFYGTPKLNWSIPNQTDKYQVSGLKAGTYNIDVQDDSGCAATSIQLVDPVLLTAGKVNTRSTSITVGEVASLIFNEVSPSGGSNKSKVLWQKNEGVNCTATWVNSVSDTLDFIEPGRLLKSTCFRRMVSDACTTLYSNVITVLAIPPLAKDSVALSGGGVLGTGKITLTLYGKAPWTVILRRVEGQDQGLDTIKSIQASPYSFIPTKVGLYTIFKVNNITISNQDNAYISALNSLATNASMSGGGELGSSIKVSFTGGLRYPLYYAYYYYENSFDALPKDTIYVNEIKTSEISFTPNKIGFYKGYYVADRFELEGKVAGSAFIFEKQNNPQKPTANIAGGGLIGSQITITVDPKGTPAPWEVLLEIETDSIGKKIFFSEYLYIEQTPYSFPSRKVGVYRIKAVNGNREGNGEAIVIINDRDSSEVFVWNAVSPNGDGKNDLFTVEIPKRLKDKSAQIVIFDREGTKIVDLDVNIGVNLALNATEDMFVFNWDCKNDAKELLNPGTYFFSFVVQDFEKDKKASKAGFIEIRR
ncbi:MAG: hypothetical protein EAZ07_07265 [Cytophagales bacterium]|nr:MAG: hypothetical protein EAZ07_07265 [Cytophagales bacterium]